MGRVFDENALPAMPVSLSLSLSLSLSPLPKQMFPHAPQQVSRFPFLDAHHCLPTWEWRAERGEC
jgi:hypothetical protein